jgi:hypothetical protein
MSEIPHAPSDTPYMSASLCPDAWKKFAQCLIQHGEVTAINNRGGHHGEAKQ